jgi:enamine deaminase RidA (YjgF/YER057c/UK114 family)
MADTHGERQAVQMIQFDRTSDFSACSRFSTAVGCEEFFMTVRTRPGIDFTTALDELSREYAAVVDREGLSDASVVFSRLFVSDFVNQQELLGTSPFHKRLLEGALSIIGQKPLGGGQLSLFSYHIRRQGNKFLAKKATRAPGPDDYSNRCVASLENYRLLYTANDLNGFRSGAYEQTKEIFDSLRDRIDENGMNLLANTIRTWIFVRDIDNQYNDMVRARREYFTAHGLTDKTRYLASTGIQGAGASAATLVAVDSLSIGGLKSGQIVRMEAPANLSPTILYNVTFERGLRVRFGDRSHLYISGTASVNDKGMVMHKGDVKMQTRRTVENLRALLREQQATAKDLAYLLVYLRNFHEWPLVEDVLRDEIGGDTPLIPFEAKVCRPAWLVEMEGVAVVPDANSFPAFA